MIEKAGEIYAKELRRFKLRIAELHRKGDTKRADRLEELMNEYLMPSNFLMYPFGEEGTVVYRRSVEKEPKK